MRRGKGEVVEELEKEIDLKARLLQVLSLANTKHEHFKYYTADSCTLLGCQHKINA